MTSNPHRCVIDTVGNYIDFVLLVEQPDGGTVPYAYTLKDGESLIQASPPAGQFARPLWNGSEWSEGGTEEEIAAWEAVEPVPIEPEPSQLELLAVEITMAMAAMQLQNDMAIAELTMAIVAGQEVSSDV